MLKNTLIDNNHYLCRPFYGYHDKKHDYLKVYFYKPSLIKKAANILQEGQVLGQSFQPHEAHIPYVLQFFIDYNLYGMSHLNIEKFTLRKEGKILLLKLYLICLRTYVYIYIYIYC